MNVPTVAPSTTAGDGAVAGHPTLNDSPAARPAAGLGTLRLLQICSPAFPIGAFAYSQGLEQAVEIGWISDAEALREWLLGMLHGSLTFTDLPLLRHAYGLWQSPASGEQTSAAEALCLEVLAYRETSELRAEEQLIGRSLARVLSHLECERAHPFVAQETTTYLVMFALAAVHFEISAQDMLGGFAFAWAENQVSAASRVMKLGQLSAQQTLSAFLADIPAAVQRSSAVAPHEVGYSSPAAFLASAWHEDQYSRLFRS